MKDPIQEIVLIIRKSGGRRIVSRTPLKNVNRFVFVYNNQYTNDPNTTQIASGAGVNSAAGNNAAIDSPDTYQQQSVGAGGKAHNKGLKRSSKQSGDNIPSKKKKKEVVIVINDQVAQLPRRSTAAAATQVASGSGNHSTGGTNSAIESAGTKQQHAVGGGSGSLAANTLVNRGKKKHRRRLQ